MIRLMDDESKIRVETTNLEDLKPIVAALLKHLGLMVIKKKGYYDNNEFKLLNEEPVLDYWEKNPEDAKETTIKW